MSGILYLVPTPVGNLSDWSPRCVETLQNVDLIAAEDTRNSMKLMNAFEIHTPMISYHQHNEVSRGEELLEKLAAGTNIALITDAGMPAISDPGQSLVKRCHERGITVSALPGPCAFVTALAMSGFDSRSFVFEGFLPTDKKEQKEVLARLGAATQTTIFYEAPHRLVKTLETLGTVLGARRVAAVRELSKRFEEVRIASVPEHLAYYAETEPKGEFVLVTEGRSAEEVAQETQAKFEDLTIEEHMALYADLPEKEAMKRVAAERGISKQDVYRAVKIKED